MRFAFLIGTKLTLKSLGLTFFVALLELLTYQTKYMVNSAIEQLKYFLNLYKYIL
jgi:hypothetical protein